MKVSVIIPTYNEEKYIEHCIKALKNQDYKGRYEIIVADSKSRDNTVRIARKYADKVVVIKKRSIAAGRNAGAKAATGDVLLFIDADTIAMPNLISEFTKRLKRKNVVGVTCPVLPFSTQLRYQLFYNFANMFVKSSIKRGHPEVFGVCCGYKRDVFEKVNGFNEKLATLEDLELSRRISKYGKIIFTEKTFVITSVRRLKRWGALKAIKRYVTNYVSYILLGKAANRKRYMPIRKPG